MPSPFPGVDPYIEAGADWLSFHNDFIGRCADALNQDLPAGYVASPTSQIRLVSPSELDWQDREPDVAVTRSAAEPAAPAPSTPSTTSVTSTASAATALQPQVVDLPERHVELDEWRVEIRRLPDRDLVTAIELLSPTNNRGAGRAEYETKRIELVRRGVNLVELDLLVGGRGPEMAGPMPPGDYYALVCRADRRPKCDVYAWGVRSPLPTALPVPLRPGDGETPLDLAAVFARTYDRGRYDQLVRYDAPPPAGLSDADRAWAAEVAARGRR